MARDGYAVGVLACLEKGTDVNTKSQIGWTALMWASQYGHDQVVRMLIEHGATKWKFCK